jgi:hypothetical protein
MYTWMTTTLIFAYSFPDNFNPIHLWNLPNMSLPISHLNPSFPRSYPQDFWLNHAVVPNWNKSVDKGEITAFFGLTMRFTGIVNYNERSLNIRGGGVIHRI